MTTAERLAQLKQDFDDVYEAGKSSGGSSDEFWEAFQNYGNRNRYQYAFLENGSEYIRPKYKVAPTDGNMAQVFHSCPKLKKLEAQYFDFSKLPVPTSSTNGNYYTFQNCYYLGEIEDIGLPGYYYAYTFSGCKRLRKISVFRSYETTGHNTNTFNGCEALEDITIEGVIATKNFNVKDCKNLSRESIASIITSLSGTTSGLAVTLSKTAVDNITYPFAYQDVTYNSWEELISSKSNWTISLV